MLGCDHSCFLCVFPGTFRENNFWTPFKGSRERGKFPRLYCMNTMGIMCKVK